MKLQHILSEATAKSAFSTTETGMPMFDNMIENPDYFRDSKGIKFIIYKNFPPSKYIAAVSKARGMSADELRGGRESKLITSYAEKMKAGEKFPLPVLDYTHGFSQEGLHRAFAAQQVGLDTMPYMVVSKV